MKAVKGYRVAEIRVTYSRKGREQGTPSAITTSAQAYQAVYPGFNHRTFGLQEQFVVLYLNRANIPLGLYRLSQGGISGTIADPRLILSVALKIAASGLILAHNHPSGNLTPSNADEELTRKIRDGSSLLDIKLLDHLILNSDGNYFSFSDERII